MKTPIDQFNEEFYIRDIKNLIFHFFHMFVHWVHTTVTYKEVSYSLEEGHINM